MMQTAKDKTIAGMLQHLGGLTPTEKRVAEMAYDAGYRAAREDAAKAATAESIRLAAESGRYFGEYGTELDGGSKALKSIAAEIRKLEPSNLASEQESANSRQD